MGFDFTYVCDLLSTLDENRILKTSTAAKNKDLDARAVARWFRQHDKRIYQKDTDQLALLSCLFPERRVDRVYWIQDHGLSHIIGRILLLGSSRRQELEQWRVSGGPDLGQCVENVMRQTEDVVSSDQKITVEEIDAAMGDIASRCIFSGPQARRARTAVNVEDTLNRLYRRLSSRDAKWHTRMILKRYSPVIVPERYTMTSLHFLLPHLLLFQGSFGSALKMLTSEPLNQYPPHPEQGLAKDLSTKALEHLNPEIGIKIGRPEYYKARSIKHCLQMADRRRMSIERKYDGEYCQVHIDLSKNTRCIQIFSKSGKDSTEDRSGIHPVLKESLRIGKPECKFSRRCIVEGELLVWNDKHGKIADFHKLRKFVARSGLYIGTDNDSPPQPYEHLMIVFFDILLLDDDVCLKRPHRERRLLLKDTVQLIDGRADIAEQKVLDLSHGGCQDRLESILGKGFRQRWEGFVLKGCEDPYFSILSAEAKGAYGRWIKLKKDYIPGLGDTVDLAIIGAKYDARDGASLKHIRKLKWTHFFIGCLVNKEGVLELNATPRFRLVDVIDQHSMHIRNVQILNQHGEFSARDPEDSGDHGFVIEYGKSTLPRADVIFKTPFVVEMLGGGFEKPSGSRFYTLRFPRLQKIHWDRTFEDAASFAELQSLAEKAREVPKEEFEEHEQWTKRLREGNGSTLYIRQRSQSVASTDSASSGSGMNVPGDEPTREDPSNPGNHIDIYVDERGTSSSSSVEPDDQGNFLAENNNLSSHQPPRNQGNSVPMKPRNWEKVENMDRRHQDEMNTTVQSNPGPKKRHADGTMVTSVPSPASKATQRQQLPLKSPLAAIPIYVTSVAVPESQTTNPLETRFTHNLNRFLRKLGSLEDRNLLKHSNPYAVSRDMALGLVLTNGEGKLGPEIREVAYELIKRLKDPSFHLPSSGKIFFLNTTGILSIEADPEDPRFCLLSTWVNISKEYYYACIKWTPTTGRPADESTDGIPYAPWETETDAQATQPRSNKLAVVFEEEELTSLGEFTSIQPVAHVTGRQYNFDD